MCRKVAIFLLLIARYFAIVYKRKEVSMKAKHVQKLRTYSHTYLVMMGNRGIEPRVSELSDFLQQITGRTLSQYEKDLSTAVLARKLKRDIEMKRLN